MKLEQNVDGDRAADQRVGIVAFLARLIVGQELRFHIGIDRKIALYCLQRLETADRTRHIQIDAESRTGQDHRPDAWRVIMYPGRRYDRSHALRNDDHVFSGHRIGHQQVLVKRLCIPYEIPEIPRVAAPATADAMTTCVPGKDIEVWYIQFIDDVLQARPMLMAAVEEHKCLAVWRPARPIVVSDRSAVVAVKLLQGGTSHCFSSWRSGSGLWTKALRPCSFWSWLKQEESACR